MLQNRRKFISTVLAGAAAVPLLTEIDSIPQVDKTTSPVRLFSKPLDSYDFDFICECVTRSGISGIDLTVRKGGKVEPESVEKVLPDLIQRAAKYNLLIDMIVTGILSASEPDTERILKTASMAGVKNYRLGWFTYNDKTDILKSIEDCHLRLSGLADLNMKYNLHGGYQNHSGELIGGPVWDLYELFRNLPSEYIGSQYDVRHAMVEGYDTWMLGMRLISGYIKTVAIKDFTWDTSAGKTQPVSVPLGEGMVDWDLYFKMLRELKLNVPVTLHVEYPLLSKDEEKLSLTRQQEIIVRKLKKDADFISTYLNKYQLT